MLGALKVPMDLLLSSKHCTNWQLLCQHSCGLVLGHQQAYLGLNGKKSFAKMNIRWKRIIEVEREVLSSLCINLHQQRLSDTNHEVPHAEFSNESNLRCYLEVRDQISHPCKMTGWLYTHKFFKYTYRVSQKERTKLRKSVPYVKLYRYNPKHLYPKLNGYGDNGQRKVWTSCISA